MEKHGTATMAETVCACLALKPAGHGHKISSELPYKTLNAAYHRGTVVEEVSRLLSSHLGKIPGLDPKTVRLMMSSDELGLDARKELNAASIKLPKRYAGGLLFGQLVPRFDNRIIARCPVTWARTYDEAIASGKDDKEARHLADKFAKVPAAKSSEFLQYRFARILANIKADGRPLPPELRNTLWDLAQRLGSLTPGAIAKEIRSVLGNVPTNLEAYFKIHPDSADALVLDPAKAEVRKAEGKRGRLSPIWSLLPQATREHALADWTRRRPVSIAALLEHSGSAPELVERLKADFAGMKPKKGAPRFGSFDEFLVRTTVTPDFPTGRAPYARPVLKQVVKEVLAGHDPTKACRATDPENGEEKTTDGVLYDLGIPSSRVRQLQAERPIDRLTNNHLVRHRMLILDRLVDDMVAEFCANGDQVGQVIVEVARELKEFSGKDRVKIKAALKCMLAQHKAASDRLVAEGITPNPTLIRKCRIAMDLNWTCPFTHRTYRESELNDLEFEHIIPRSQRLSDSMAGLVLTRKEINSLKGKRTALQFVNESANDDRIVSPKSFEDWVKRLRVAKKEMYPDDYARQNARKRLLLVEEYTEKERTFTEGQLTQSSQIMKIAMGVLKMKLPGAFVDPVPGPVTAEIRKTWKLAGSLSLACPEILTEEGRTRLKDEIRDITHLHHALDAATLALAAHYFPLRQHGLNQSGLIWQALMKRRRSKEEKEFLHKFGIFDTFQRPRDGEQQVIETDVKLRDLDKSVKEALALSLAEGRVMQHLPADRSGAKAELTTWGVVAIVGEHALIIQRPNRSGFELVPDTTARRWKDKPIANDAARHLKEHGHLLSPEQYRLVERGLLKLSMEKLSKLLGPRPKEGVGKLKEIKGAMIIGENYGLALDPEPVVIPFHDVQQRLEEIRKANGGKQVRVLRNGMLIRLSGQNERDGVWSIYTVQASMKVDLVKPGTVGRPKKGGQVWREVSIYGLLKKGIEILPRRYTGYPVTR
jgi:CRISPR-associated endonuclease Csn1